MIWKKACVLLFTLFILTVSASAVTISGIAFPDTVNVGGQNLILNGGGKRTDYGIGVYVAALYLKQKSANAAQIVAADQPMDVKIQITSIMVSSANMKSGFRQAFNNTATSDISALKPKIEAFLDTFKGLKNHDIYDFAYIPGKGVQVSRNGAVVSTIQGLDFKKALYGIWLGPKAVEKDLKENMLGK